MQVEMPGDARSGALSDVKTDIKAVGVVGATQEDFTIPGKMSHLFDLVMGGLGQGAHMTKSNHEKVTNCVGKAIKNDKVVVPSGQNMVFTILISCENRTKNTARGGLG